MSLVKLWTRLGGIEHEQRQSQDDPPGRNLLSSFMSLTLASSRRQTSTRDTPPNTTVGSPQPRSRAPRISSQPARPLSDFSTPAVPDSAWCSYNFMLGAGMVIIQPSTDQVVVLYDQKYKYWFLPRGRKDVGESLETTALREAYEESGYQVDFLPLYSYTRAPSPPGDPAAGWRPHTEPIFTTVTSWSPERHRNRMGGEYITFWYVGQIPEDAVHTEGTGMPDEQDYTTHLRTYEDAAALLMDPERTVLSYAWDVYLQSLDVEKRLAATRPQSEPHSSPDFSEPLERGESR